MFCHSTYAVDNRHRVGILLDYTWFNDMFKSRLLIAKKRTYMQKPKLQGGSAKAVCIAKFFEANNPA